MSINVHITTESFYLIDTQLYNSLTDSTPFFDRSMGIFKRFIDRGTGIWKRCIESGELFSTGCDR